MTSISKEIFTNHNLINNLNNQFKKNSLPNSLIFFGPKGIGKNTLAIFLIKEIYQSLSKKDQYKQHINLIYNNTHPNIKYINKEYDSKKNKFNKSITIDQIRNLENFFYKTSTDLLPKFIIIDSADDLNLNSANALLKILEESKSNTFFILISHQISSLLPTVRSRCIKYYIKKPSVLEFNKIVNLKNDYDIKDDLNFLYDLTNGSPGISLDIISNDLKDLYYIILNIFEDNQHALSSKLKELVNKVSDYSNDQYKIFLFLVKFILINITKINLNLNITSQFTSNILSQLTKAAAQINNKTSFKMLDYLNKNENNLFIYNLDKRIFSLNIFAPLKFINE